MVQRVPKVQPERKVRRLSCHQNFHWSCHQNFRLSYHQNFRLSYHWSCHQTPLEALAVQDCHRWSRRWSYHRWSCRHRLG